MVGLQSEVDQISNLKTTLHPALICVQFLLVLGHLQIILQDLKDVLTLLYPIFGLGGPTVPKDHIGKSGCIIAIQCSERGHSYEHVICRVVTIFPQVQPCDPCSLLS